MKIGILQEGDARPPAQRYLEMLDEATLADECGFSTYGVSERHFLPSQGISAPETFLAAVAARTSRIDISFMSSLLLPFNHPVRVAEQICTLDIISKGRAQACAARSQQPQTLETFGVDPTQTRALWDEALDILIGAMTNKKFEHHGKFWNIPPFTLNPTPVQTPHPPILVTSTSVDSHRIAGEKGLGVLSGNSLVGGWPWVEQVLGIYRSALADAKPISNVVPKVCVAALVAHCAPTKARAREEAEHRVLAFLDQTTKRRAIVAASSPDYAYQSEGFEEIQRHRSDFDYMIDRSPYFTVGTPEFFIERCRRLEAMGVDEVIFTIEGMSHVHHAQTMELLGKHVIPEFAK